MINLGIFAGGFKPFTSGHFSKLALAAHENDFVFLFYGLSKRQKGSDFIYTEEMAYSIFDITKRAIERAFSNVYVVEAKPSPIAMVYSTIGQVFLNKDPSLLNSYNLDPFEISSVKIYTDPIDAEQNYLKYFGTPKEKQYFGEAVSEGRLIFDYGIDKENSMDRILKVLSKHTGLKADLNKPYALVRGSEVRSYIVAKDADKIKNFLPPIFNEAEKNRVANILLGEESISFENIANRIYESILKKKIIKEDAGPKAHILNIYEDLDLSLGELRDLFRDLVEGEIDGVQEKLDGQNLTFTVRDGNVEIFSKGASWSRIQKPGKSYFSWDSDYSHMPSVRDAYKKCHRALQDFINSEFRLANRLFQNGKIVVEAAMLIPENANTIAYNSPQLVFIGCYALDPELLGFVNGELYDLWIDKAISFKSDINFKNVPILKLNRLRDSDFVLDRLNHRIDDLQLLAGLDDSSTIGDLLIRLACLELIEMGVSESVSAKIARRIITGDTSYFTKNQTVHAPALWSLVQKLESSYFKERVAIPLERVIHELAYHIFRNLEFVIASNDPSSGKDIRDFVKRTRSSLRSNKINSDSKQIDLIKLSLDRIGNEELYEKAVEGIVFEWNGATRKLTGLFTPINKLKGVFKYGKSPAKMY